MDEKLIHEIAEAQESARAALERVRKQMGPRAKRKFRFKRTLEQVCQDYVELGVCALVRCVADKRAKWCDRIDAVELILAYAHGKPKEHIDLAQSNNVQPIINILVSSAAGQAPLALDVLAKPTRATPKQLHCESIPTLPDDAEK